MTSAQSTEAPQKIAIQEDWRELVDLSRLQAWMDEQGLESGPIIDPALLPGGTQNVLLKFRRGDRDFVLRRPPRHPRTDGNVTMRREASVLGALAGTNVPHPGLIAACSETDVLGTAFYLMEPVTGFNAAMGLPAFHAGNPAIRHRMGLAMAEAIARLGALDPVARGLQGLGRTEGFLERQVPRWLGVLESYAEYPGWPGPGEIPGVQEVAAWLEANRPSSFTPGIMHGDYHISNVMFRHDSGELAAVVDWELATVGDPLLDLGWLVATWPGAKGYGAVGSQRIQPFDGFPDTRELIAHYARHSSRDLSHIDWYVVLACFKLGLILEGTYARAHAGKAPMSTGQALHRSCVALLSQAVECIKTSG